MISLDRNDWKVINLSFVLPICVFGCTWIYLKLRKYCNFGRKKFSTCSACLEVRFEENRCCRYQNISIWMLSEETREIRKYIIQFLHRSASLLERARIRANSSKDEQIYVMPSLSMILCSHIRTRPRLCNSYTWNPVFVELLLSTRARFTLTDPIRISAIKRSRRRLATKVRTVEVCTLATGKVASFKAFGLGRIDATACR